MRTDGLHAGMAARKFGEVDAGDIEIVEVAVIEPTELAQRPVIADPLASPEDELAEESFVGFGWRTSCLAAPSPGIKAKARLSIVVSFPAGSRGAGRGPVVTFRICDRDSRNEPIMLQCSIGNNAGVA